MRRWPSIRNSIRKRLGWWGWSWGGTFTLYAMTHSDRFRAGVAVAPVTDWRNYDSIYTERYMSQPARLSGGLQGLLVVNSAANLKGRLLLAHGTGDDNVHIENTVQFVQKLIEAGIPYDLQIYPRKTHSIAGPDVRTHLYNRILAQFEMYLKPQPVAAVKRGEASHELVTNLDLREKTSTGEADLLTDSQLELAPALHFVAAEEIVLLAARSNWSTPGSRPGARPRPPSPGRPARSR